MLKYQKKIHLIKIYAAFFEKKSDMFKIKLIIQLNCKYWPQLPNLCNLETLLSMGPYKLLKCERFHAYDLGEDILRIGQKLHKITINSIKLGAATWILQMCKGP